MVYPTHVAGYDTKPGKTYTASIINYFLTALVGGSKAIFENHSIGRLCFLVLSSFGLI